MGALRASSDARLPRAFRGGVGAQHPTSSSEVLSPFPRKEGGRGMGAPQVDLVRSDRTSRGAPTVLRSTLTRHIRMARSGGLDRALVGAAMVVSSTGIDRDAVALTVATLIRQLGLDPADEGLAGTPARIADMYAELFEGLWQDPREQLQVQFAEGHDEMVILRDISFYSMCEHHFLPFHGVAHVGYLPNGRIVGLSKLARAVEIFARRPQVQERLTSQIADSIEEVVGAKGVGVVIEAEHLCMTARGVRKPGALMVTSAMRGKFRDEVNTRQEFLRLIEKR